LTVAAKSAIAAVSAISTIRRPVRLRSFPVNASLALALAEIYRDRL
jgi:hypothetical protein